MYRFDIINKLINERNYTSYLEIGLDNPFLNFVKIKCKKKESVDPYNPDLKISTVWNDSNVEIFSKFLTYRMTSDEFFATYPNKKYDLIFIDGLHIEEQCDKDIKNSLSHLNKGGVVVVHDCLPINEASQSENNPTGSWVGTVWKSIVKYSMLTNLDIKVINTDWGVGLIEYSEELKFEIPMKLEMDYSFFEKNKANLLRIINL